MISLATCVPQEQPPSPLLPRTWLRLKSRSSRSPASSSWTSSSSATLATSTELLRPTRSDALERKRTTPPISWPASDRTGRSASSANCIEGSMACGSRSKAKPGNEKQRHNAGSPGSKGGIKSLVFQQRKDERWLAGMTTRKLGFGPGSCGQRRLGLDRWHQLIGRRALGFGRHCGAAPSPSPHEAFYASGGEAKA